MLPPSPSLNRTSRRPFARASVTGELVALGLTMSFIRISRDSGYADRIRLYRILLDNQQIAELRNGETKEIPISAGSHCIAAKIHWCGSQPIHFSISAGEILTFSVTSSLRGWRILLVAVLPIFARNSYLNLRRAP